jgi:poly [ADP-ribose] polymerase 1
MKCTIPDEFKNKSFFSTCSPVAEDRAVREMTIKVDEIENTQKIPSTSKPKKITNFTLKDGSVVDPKSKLERVAHVYRPYSSTLGLTDIEKNKNSFFKLQILESDVSHIGQTSFWLFSSWGRIGTEIGDSKVETFQTSDLASKRFEQIYEEQTGNDWKSETFKKLPGKFYPIDVNYNDEIESNFSVKSFLAPQVEELMKLLFDVKAMKLTMRQFQLDLEKMPLGKLSVKQLQLAYLALAELEHAINNKSSNEELIGLSNKFYTLIPHNFGLEKAQIIDNFQKVNAKREMVDSLLDMAFAYDLMAQSAANKTLNSFDAYYRQLNADIKPVPQNSEEFKLIETYIHNSKGPYSCSLVEVFKVKRHGEEKRYEQFKRLHNRQLLWHGSTLTNFVSIVSKGLLMPQSRIGIYFADRIEKSIAYCRSTNNMGLLVICEVALGKMTMNALQPAAGAHSAKLDLGNNPNQRENHIRADGSIIPLGRPMNTGSCSEFIVFNEAQVKMEYLVKVKFAYGQRIM